MAARYGIGRTSLEGPIPIGLAILILVLLVRFKVDTALVILAAGLIGFFLL